MLATGSKTLAFRVDWKSGTTSLVNTSRTESLILGRIISSPGFPGKQGCPTDFTTHIDSSFLDILPLTMGQHFKEHASVLVFEKMIALKASG